jgi:hypothetical protein
MALRGNLKTFALSAVCRMIHEEAKTGILEVTSGGRTIQIYFKQGVIVFLSGNASAELSLGALLKASGLIDEGRLQQALQKATAAGKRLGVVLIEQGHISKARLVRILHYQFKEAVTTMLTWREGEFEYTDGLGDYVEDIGLTIDPIRLVAEAQKWKEYRHHIPNDQAVFQIKDSRQKLQSFESDGALRVMLLIDGRRNVNQIMAATGLPRLAVYKALTTLVTQGIIVRKMSPSSPPSEGHLPWYAIVEMFLTLLQNILASMTAELGRQRAVAYLAGCMRRHPAYAEGLDLFKAEDDLNTNLTRIRDHGARTLQGLEQKVLVEGFLMVVGSFLRQGYRVLGFKAVQQMIVGLCDGLQQVPVSHQGLARTVNEFLQPLVRDEKMLQKPSQVAMPKHTPPEREPGVSLSRIQHLDRISASTIIAFYHQTFQMLIRDLELEIGSQGTNLFQRLVAASDAYDTLLAPFDLQADASTNIKRMHEHLSEHGYRLEKERLIQAFQHLLAALLQEEKRLLGPKATRASLLNLKQDLNQDEPGTYRLLQEHLTGYVKHLTGQLGV